MCKVLYFASYPWQYNSCNIMLDTKPIKHILHKDDGLIVTKMSDNPACIDLPNQVITQVLEIINDLQKQETIDYGGSLNTDRWILSQKSINVTKSSDK